MNTHHPSAPSRRLIRLATMLTIIVAGSALQAAETSIIGKPQRPTDAATIRTLEEESRRALRDRDYPTLERLWSEDFIVNTPANAVAQNRAVVFDMFRRGLGAYTSKEKRIECIAFNGDLAIVMGSETIMPHNAAGATTGETVERRYTNIWRFENKTWRLIARQATNLPPGAPPPTPAKS